MNKGSFRPSASIPTCAVVLAADTYRAAWHEAFLAFRAALSASNARALAAEEALRFYAEAWDSEPNGDPRIPGDASDWTVEPTEALLADGGSRARTTLATMGDKNDG